MSVENIVTLNDEKNELVTNWHRFNSLKHSTSLPYVFTEHGAKFINLKFQFGISSWGGTRKLPNVFTEQGVAMLSSAIRSEKAVKIN